ncbi:MAG: hypothetical protein U5S82_13955 [Gammaproteobacteria bacterium]|nr:hypothetical protein [Gammaproteobacteria bacterium]
MIWANAVVWADNLVFGGFDDWRLPTLGPIAPPNFSTSLSNNATTDWGWAKTTTDGTDGGWRDGAGNPVSEMGHMFYVNLGNLGLCTPNDADPGSCITQTGSGLADTGLFDNLQSGVYWSRLERISSAWIFSFDNGGQGTSTKINERFAWAVRSGDVAAQVVPVPAAAWLLCSGVMVLLGLGRRARRHSALR